MNQGNAAKNILSSDVEIKGNVRFSGELTCDGKIDGEVHSEGTLHLGENGMITGNIAVGSIVIRGKVNGNVTAKDKVDIKSKSEVFGDVRSSKLVIEEGVTFVGRTEVNPNKVNPQGGSRPEAGKSPEGNRPTEPAKPAEAPKAGIR